MVRSGRDQRAIVMLKAEVKRLRTALGFYADAENWGYTDWSWHGTDGDEYPEYMTGAAEADKGERAREALGGKE